MSILEDVSNKGRREGRNEGRKGRKERNIFSLILEYNKHNINKQNTLCEKVLNARGKELRRGIGSFGC